MAHFEIYILNYNGAQFLPDCLNSLRQIDRGTNTVVVNVVDNGSTDGSRELVQNSYPEVNFISLNSNIGFSRGNNAGVEIRKRALALEGRKANFHVFLNNIPKASRTDRGFNSCGIL